MVEKDGAGAEPGEWVPTGDEVLDRIGVLPSEFRVEQLIGYFYERFRLHFGYPYPEDYYRDRTCLRNALSWYGGEHAVGIVRFVFEARNGMVNGEVASTNVFARNCRWKADEVYNAYRVALAEAAPQGDLDDLIRDWSAK